jgi:glycosyltransferase involved in cell wall biosynthesis
MTKISVIIPTFRRPEGLRRALLSVLAQQSAPDFEIVVVDNAPEGGARETVSEIAATAIRPIRFVHEKRPGVATARNAGWAATLAPRIAFLDDDEEATPHWLAALDRAATELEADAVFGPIEAVAPPTGWAAHAKFLSDFFGRSGPAATQLVDTYWGCGNSLIDRDRAGLMAPPFDPAHDRLGGEDDLLFSTMQARGARFGWAADALAYEHVPADRANLGYVLQRSFAFGQGPSQTAAGQRAPLRVAFWMLLGAGQALAYGAAAAALWPTGSERRAFMLGRATQGLGKIFWFDRFAPRLYGAS